MNTPLDTGRCRRFPLWAVFPGTLRRVAWALLWLCAMAAPAFSAGVRIWETSETIPTYLAALPSPIPRFYSGRTYQGAKATFYPYPVQDQLTDVKTNQAYRMVYLENEYLKIGVLPELGGRIFSAVDKSNGYDFFYRQHVIKPALIGMLGAWISGGVEWNIPHHHRASSYSPVEYTAVTNADGSATLWVGETELRHRMRWLVGMTLYPDRSCLELNCKVFNRTPFAHPMLFWINAAVHANTNYQVIFPPSTEWAAQHAKPEFASWPMARQNYGGVDYTRGVDISWWKNHPSPVSFFAWNYEDDWFGGYDHGKQAGVVHVADHHVAPGKKFFEWGNGPEGEMWSKVLTDDDGPYLELMAGAWSDNQPDYSWIQPGETREWQHWWYPIRDMGGVKMANKDFAINLEVTNRIAKLAINTTAKHDISIVSLELGTNTLIKKTVAIDPAHPFTATVNLDREVQPDQLTVRYPGGIWSPRKPKDTPMPKPVERPKNPKDYTSTDELYFTGQRIEQLCSPSFEAAPYYQEMLRRDPGDYRANSAMGILLSKQWRWQEAETSLRKAIERATANHIRPKDTEAFYYLGVVLKAQNKNEEATVAFQKAAWQPAWQATAYFELASLASRRSDFDEALDLVERSLARHSLNVQARNLRASLLRRLDRNAEAAKCANETLTIDPLNLQTRVEYHLATRANADGKVPMPKWADWAQSEQSVLDLAINYWLQGFPESAGSVLFDFENAMNASSWDKISPMMFYASAICPDHELAVPVNDYYQHASKANPDACFPSRFEEEFLLRQAMDRNKDARAPYYLGCLLYDNQPENAIKAWEESRNRDDKFALSHRNLGLAYAQHEKNIPKAIASLEKAVALNPREPRFFYELDLQYEAGSTPVAKREELLTKNREVVGQRDDSLTRRILVLMAAGKLDEALAILTTHRFHNWEGSSDIRNVYVDARLLRGQQHLQAKRAAEALKDFQAAQEFPANLEVGRPRRAAKAAQIAYHLALAHEALGNADKAKEFFTQAGAGRGGGANEAGYYRAQALQKLGRADEAKPIFENLAKQGQESQAGEPADYFAKFGEKRAECVRKADAHYLAGLGNLGLGRKAEALAELAKALDLHPAHYGALAARDAAR